MCRLIDGRNMWTKCLNKTNVVTIKQPRWRFQVNRSLRTKLYTPLNCWKLKTKKQAERRIYGQIINLFPKQHIDGAQHLFNNIYRTGVISQDWLISIFISTTRKASSRTCGQYRTIRLRSDTLKLFLWIVHGRIYYKLLYT